MGMGLGFLSWLSSRRTSERHRHDFRRSRRQFRTRMEDPIPRWPSFRLGNLTRAQDSATCRRKNRMPEAAGMFELAAGARKRKMVFLRNSHQLETQGRNAVSKSTTGPAGSASRRAILLNSVSLAAGGFILSVPAARTALAQTKVTHEIAKYQDTPKNDQKCSTCIQFVTPGSCKIVADPISPDGWCQFYGAKT